MDDIKGTKITVLGSFVVDLMARSPHLPVPGETVLSESFKMGPGGKGSNQATAAARAGAHVTMITKLGKDIFADVAIDHFKKENIGTEYVYTTDKYETGTALIIVDENAENMIAVTISACGRITDDEVKNAEKAIASSKVLLTQLETNIDAMMCAVDIAKKYSIPVILNPAPIQKIPDELYGKIDILTPNETEASKLSGININTIENAKEAGEVLLKKGASNVVITLGRKGSIIISKDTIELVPSFKVDAIDTTGAGDAFNGALAASIAEGAGLKDAVVFANAAGALSVTKIGTAPSMPERNEIDEFISKNLKG